MVRKTELQYWNDITLDHMSEESNDPSNSEVSYVIHKPTWRFEGIFYDYVPQSSFLIGFVSHLVLNCFLELLDDRYLKSARSKAGMFLRKTRQVPPLHLPLIPQSGL